MPDQPARDSERVLAEALRAKAGGGDRRDATMAEKPTAQPLTVLQLVLASLIGGLVVGILVAVLTLL